MQHPGVQDVQGGEGVTFPECHREGGRTLWQGTRLVLPANRVTCLLQLYTPLTPRKNESQITTGSYTCGAQLPKTSPSVLQRFRKATSARNTQHEELSNSACTRENNVTLSPTGNCTVTAADAHAHLQSCPAPRPPPTSSSQRLGLPGHQTVLNAGEQPTLEFTLQQHFCPNASGSSFFLQMFPTIHTFHSVPQIQMFANSFRLLLELPASPAQQQLML